MRESYIVTNTLDDSLIWQASLYASGELDESESAAFERRLAEEQPVREALCQAVQLSQMLAGIVPLRPEPSYREHVRQRLSVRRAWGWLVGPRIYRGHPALWSAVGAAAAVLFVIALAKLPFELSAERHPPVRGNSIEEELAPAPELPPQVARTNEAVRLRNELHNSQRQPLAPDAGPPLPVDMRWPAPPPEAISDPLTIPQE